MVQTDSPNLLRPRQGALPSMAPQENRALEKTHCSVVANRKTLTVGEFKTLYNNDDWNMGVSYIGTLW